MPAQMHPAHAPGFVERRIGAFEPFTALAQQPLPAGAPNPPTIGIHRLACRRLPFPVAPPAIRFRDVTPGPKVRERDHRVVGILVVGGEPRQVDETRERARGRADNVVFAGQRPAVEISDFVAAADVLVSPRMAGTNTPLKIYSYLRSGRPIVATRLRTHTQVLDDETALLVSPDPASFAEAVGLVLDKPDLGGRLAEAAKRLAAARYSRESYLAKTGAAYERLLHASDAESPTSSSSDTSPVQRSKVS